MQAEAKGRGDIIRALMRDLTTELIEQGALRKISPWVVRPGHLWNVYSPQKGEENITAAGVLSIPLLPNVETGDADYARLVFIHVRELVSEKMDAVIALATSLKSRALTDSGWAGNIRDTDVIVIADTMEKGANLVFAKRCRSRGPEGGRGSMVFSAKQPLGLIRKHLYSILAKWLNARADAVQARTEERGYTLFGKLAEAVEYVRALGEALLHLAERISLPTRWIGRRKPQPAPAEELERLRAARPLRREEGRAGVKWRGAIK